MKKPDGHRVANMLLVVSAIALLLVVGLAIYLRSSPLPLPKDRPPGVAS